MGDVRDLDVSPDGTTIVFSLRLPLNPNKPNTDVTQPNWNIYPVRRRDEDGDAADQRQHHRRP